MQAIVDSILQTIQQHSEWAWLIVFLIAFIESIAIFGLFMPGWVLLVGVGTMIGADALEFIPIVISAYLGAVLGEYLSFYAGYHYHEAILKWKFVAKHHLLIERSKTLFKKHGALAVFVGRFIGPLRAVIPLVAGISEMPKRTFFWVNITSGLIWAPLYLIPGIIIGAALKLEKETSSILLFVLLLVILVLWMAIGRTKKLFLTWQKSKQKIFNFAMVNTLLSWSVFVVLIIVFAKSPYYDFSVQIFNVVLSKVA